MFCRLAHDKHSSIGNLTWDSVGWSSVRHANILDMREPSTIIISDPTVVAICEANRASGFKAVRDFKPSGICTGSYA